MAAKRYLGNLLQSVKSIDVKMVRYQRRAYVSTLSGQRKDFKKRTRKGPRVFAPLLKKPQMKAEEFNQDIEWSSVYQTARPYDPYLISLPIRMGRSKPGEVSQKSIANVELLKIPNFFHLTPPAIEKHCEALKKLCTPWPSNLPNLPLKILTRSYLFPSHNIRHDGSRIVHLTFSLKDLNLSSHSRNKMVLLAGERYNAKKDEITLVGKECPTSKQNTEYVMYLMKVLYMESIKCEDWETIS